MYSIMYIHKHAYTHEGKGEAEGKYPEFKLVLVKEFTLT